MTYFVTSADSASPVMGSLTSRGSLHPPTWLVVTWGVLMTAVRAAAVRAMVGDAVTEQGPDRHPRLRRVAGSKGRDREDGPGGSGA